MNQAVLIFEEIHSMVYITKDGQMYATDVKLLDYEVDIKNSTYLNNLKESNGRTQVFDLENTCMNYEKSVDMVTMGKRVNNVITGKLEGYMFLNIEASYFSNSVENSISSYFLFDSRKQRLRENAKQQEIEEQWFTLKYGPMMKLEHWLLSFSICQLRELIEKVNVEATKKREYELALIQK